MTSGNSLRVTNILLDNTVKDLKTSLEKELVQVPGINTIIAKVEKYLRVLLLNSTGQC